MGRYNFAFYRHFSSIEIRTRGELSRVANLSVRCSKWKKRKKKRKKFIGVLSTFKTLKRRRNFRTRVSRAYFFLVSFIFIILSKKFISVANFFVILINRRRWESWHGRNVKRIIVTIPRRIRCHYLSSNLASVILQF